MALEPAPAFVWGAGGAQMTPDQIAAQRKVAQAMMAQGMDYSPVQSPWQGVARVAQAMMGGLEAGQADAAAKTNQKAESDLLANIFGGGASAATTPTAPTATASVSTPMGATSIPAGKDEFINTVMPLAQEASAKTGIDPRIIVAQAALESAWGKSAPGNNLFGIKSHGAPGGNTLPTTEIVNGQPVQTTDSFRAYASPADSVSGYADFMLKNPRYAPMRNALGVDAQIAALGQSGYATDPNYAAKIGEIVKSLPAPAPAQSVETGDQSSPLDTAQYPAGPVGAPGAQMAQAAPQPSAAPQAVPATPQAAPGVNPALLRAMSSPYVSDGTKKILGLVLSQQMEAAKNASDPLRQLQMEKLRADIGKTGTTAPTVQRVKQPDGSEVAVQWDAASSSWVPLKAPEGGNPVGSPKLTEQQSKDVGFYNRGRKLLPRLEQQDQALTDLASTAGGSISNYFKTDKFRQAEQTGRELLAVILRKDTGAAVTPQEFTMYGDIYLPRPGDDAATVVQKRAARATAIEGLKMGLGPAEIIFRSREAAEAAKASASPSSAAPSGQIPEGATAINPQTGETIILKNGKWVPLS